MKVTVFVTPKKNVLDPQGAAVEHAIHSLGHPEVAQVRVGKTIAFDFPGEDSADRRAALDKLCTDLLSNPVIEDYSYRID